MSLRYRLLSVVGPTQAIAEFLRGRRRLVMRHQGSGTASLRARGQPSACFASACCLSRNALPSRYPIRQALF